MCGGSLVKEGTAKATVLEQFVPWLAEGGEAVTTADVAVPAKERVPKRSYGELEVGEMTH